ncbi:hypothetical protein DFH09DRAFT_1084337 [Mycena vulgaris]|nr:hypothetical protein DFH09DRAFT_1084337 [Mycena vulgaris]
MTRAAPRNWVEGSDATYQAVNGRYQLKSIYYSALCENKERTWMHEANLAVIDGICGKRGKGQLYRHKPFEAAHRLLPISRMQLWVGKQDVVEKCMFDRIGPSRALPSSEDEYLERSVSEDVGTVVATVLANFLSECPWDCRRRGRISVRRRVTARLSRMRIKFKERDPQDIFIWEDTETILDSRIRVILIPQGGSVSREHSRSRPAPVVMRESIGLVHKYPYPDAGGPGTIGGRRNNSGSRQLPFMVHVPVLRVRLSDDASCVGKEEIGIHIIMGVD